MLVLGSLQGRPSRCLSYVIRASFISAHTMVLPPRLDTVCARHLQIWLAFDVADTSLGGMEPDILGRFDTVGGTVSWQGAYGVCVKLLTISQRPYLRS